MTTIPLPAGPPKRRILESAFGKMTLSGYEFGRTPEEINDALFEFNMMMLEWPFSTLGYVQPTYGVGSADELSGVPAETTSILAYQLALRLAPNMGKTLAPEAQVQIQRGMALLHAIAATVPSMPFQAHTPRGAGSRSRGFGPFIEETTPVDLSYDPGDLAGLIE